MTKGPKGTSQNSGVIPMQPVWAERGARSPMRGLNAAGRAHFWTRTKLCQLCTVAIWLVALSLVLSPHRVFAQEQEQTPPREVRFEWDAERRYLYVSVNFRDVMTKQLIGKLRDGFRTTIVFTAAVFQAGQSEPVSTTAQTCNITYLVWDEVFKVEIQRPGYQRTEKTLSVEGVLRRCTQARRLLAASSDQVPTRAAVLLQARVQVNPVSEKVLTKIKRWVSRPTSTGTVSPGDALFSTFTGLFLQRIGEAERQLAFRTRAVVPLVLPKPEKKKEEE